LDGVIREIKLTVPKHHIGKVHRVRAVKTPCILDIGTRRMDGCGKANYRAVLIPGVYPPSPIYPLESLLPWSQEPKSLYSLVYCCQFLVILQQNKNSLAFGFHGNDMLTRW
jgi:hypothetical protein